jgi:hypothetical protein
MIWIAVGDDQVPAGDGAGDQQSPRLDAIGIDAIGCAVQAGNALYADRGRSSALNPGAHGRQQTGKIANLGLARAVFHQCFAVGEDRRHQ